MDQTIYDENKGKLKSFLLENTEFEIDDQRSSDLDQVAVWCKSFGKNWSICFQNGDMNGSRRGEAIFNNEGANEGLYELREILESHDQFNILNNDNPAWPHLWFDEFVHEFVSDYSESINADKYFDNE